MAQWHGIVAKGQLLIAKFPKCAESTGIKVSGKNTEKVNQFYILIFGAGSYSICNVGSCWLLHHFSKRKREINTFSLARIAECMIRYSKKRKNIRTTHYNPLGSFQFGPASGTPRTKEVFFIFIFYLLLAKGYNLVAPLVACPTANAALPRREKDKKYTDE